MEEALLKELEDLRTENQILRPPWKRCVGKNRQRLRAQTLWRRC